MATLSQAIQAAAKKLVLVSRARYTDGEFRYIAEVNTAAVVPAADQGKVRRVADVPLGFVRLRPDAKPGDARPGESWEPWT